MRSAPPDNAVAINDGCDWAWAAEKKTMNKRVEEQWVVELFDAKEILEICWSFVYFQKSSNLFKSICPLGREEKPC
jgi:hypothetical protein